MPYIPCKCLGHVWICMFWTSLPNFGYFSRNGNYKWILSRHMELFQIRLFQVFCVRFFLVGFIRFWTLNNKHRRASNLCAHACNAIAHWLVLHNDIRRCLNMHLNNVYNLKVGCLCLFRPRNGCKPS